MGCVGMFVMRVGGIVCVGMFVMTMRVGGIVCVRMFCCERGWNCVCGDVC